jgi:hypothetical protein
MLQTQLMKNTDNRYEASRRWYWIGLRVGEGEGTTAEAATTRHGGRRSAWRTNATNEHERR